jgi:hypothetical protein
MLVRYLDEDGFFLYSRHVSLVVSFTLVLSCRDDVSVATYRDQRKRVVSIEHKFSFESNVAVNLSIYQMCTYFQYNAIREGFKILYR